jgi:hypothetical protein
MSKVVEAPGGACRIINPHFKAPVDFVLREASSFQEQL